MSLQQLLLEYVTAFRGLLFLCCVGYWWMLYSWVRPTPQAVRRGLLAALVQFWLGLVVDMGYVQVGAWVYRPMPFSVGGVPIDLHLDNEGQWLAERIQEAGEQPLTFIVSWENGCTTLTIPQFI